jgi:hypothetical protein
VSPPGVEVHIVGRVACQEGFALDRARELVVGERAHHPVEGVAAVPGGVGHPQK